jgi:hypothetical protein
MAGAARDARAAPRAPLIPRRAAELVFLSKLKTVQTMTDFNITARYGDRRGFSNFWRAFVAQIFGADDGYPKTASLRGARAFQGGLRIVPLALLSPVELPPDYPILDLDNNIDEAAAQAKADTGKPIPVTLPASGPPVIARAYMPVLARARELGVDEVPIRVFWS